MKQAHQTGIAQGYGRRWGQVRSLYIESFCLNIDKFPTITTWNTHVIKTNLKKKKQNRL